MVMISPYTSINELRNFELGRKLKRVNDIQLNSLRSKGVNSFLLTAGLLLDLNKQFLESRYGMEHVPTITLSLPEVPYA